MKLIKKWWMEAIGYQIYPKSFKDSNNDGIGDLKGIISKLDYLQYLGVDLIWLCPVYQSPMDDNGYDVSDFYDIANEFGTLEDMKELIKQLHQRKMRIVMDLVLNHTSDEHPWFMESRKSKENKYHDYYIWHDGKVVNGKLIPPNNLPSFFAGSCWNYDDNIKQFYMKIFSDKMPDLNWCNKEMRYQLYEMTKWWLDLGIDGFRVDAIAHLGRDFTFQDGKVHPGDIYSYEYKYYSNRPELHDYLKEMNYEVFSKSDCMTVGEVGGGASPEEAVKYSGYKANELNMTFTFDHCWENGAYGAIAKRDDEIITNLVSLKKQISKWQNGLWNKGWNPIYWLNHDHPRVMSQYGNSNVQYHQLSGMMLCNSLYFLWGTPFIYNGEEIGMTNVNYQNFEDFHDIWIKKMREEANERGIDDNQILTHLRRSSRDNARTPMQWDDSEYAGFSKTKPWIKMAGNHHIINVKAQINNPASLLNYYKKVIELRKNSNYHEVITYGKFKLLKPKHKNLFIYTRTLKDKKIMIISNFFDNIVKINWIYQNCELIISNYNDTNISKSELTLRAYESFVIEIKGEKK